MGLPSMMAVVDGKDEKTVTDGLVGGMRGGFFFVEGGGQWLGGETPYTASLEAFAVILCSREAAVGLETQIPPLKTR